MPGTVVITGGGTGGHVFPMQAIAEHLRELGWPAGDIRFVGSTRGQDREILGAGEIALTTLPGRGLRRSLRPRDLYANAHAALELVVALCRALYDVRHWRPAAVVSVGGYASFAVDSAAWVWRRPLILVNFDAVPGAVHRLFARYAIARCVAFGDDAPGVTVTGTPLREAIEAVARDQVSRHAARASMNPPIEEGRRVIVVMSGSLGSTRVNRAVSELARLWTSRRDVTIIHVSGRRDFASVQAAAPARGGLDYRVVEFADMASLWAVADVAVCRAGAITVAELAALAIPSVLVPLPGAPDDHQTKNALRLVEVGGAVVMSDATCTGENLSRVLGSLLDSGTLSTMAEGARRIGRLNAAEAIAKVIASVAR